MYMSIELFSLHRYCHTYLILLILHIEVTGAIYARHAYVKMYNVYIINSNSTYSTVVVYTVFEVGIKSGEIARLCIGFTGIPRPYYGNNNNNNNTLWVTRHGHYII